MENIQLGQLTAIVAHWRHDCYFLLQKAAYFFWVTPRAGVLIHALDRHDPFGILLCQSNSIQATPQLAEFIHCMYSCRINFP
jgi:hypothetical protein